MLVGGPRQRRPFGARPSARVRELQPGHLGRVEQGPQLGDLVDGAIVEDQLVRIGTPVGTNRGRLAPHEPAPAGTESLPATPHEVGRATVGGAVPSLHRQHGEPVRRRRRAGGSVVDRHRRREHAGRIDAVVDRDVDADRRTVLAERLDRVELLDLRPPHAHVVSSDRPGVDAFEDVGEHRPIRLWTLRCAARRVARRRPAAQFERHRRVVAVPGNRRPEREVTQGTAAGRSVRGNAGPGSPTSDRGAQTPRERTSTARAGSRSRTSPCRWRGRCR